MTNEQKLNAWVLMGMERNSLNADSLNLFANETQKLALALNNEEAELEALLMKGHVFNKRGEARAGIELAEKQILKEYTKLSLQHTQKKFYLLKGFILNVINKPKEAQETFFTVLKKAENDDDIYVQAAALNGIGWSYQNLNNITEAINWYRKAIILLNRSNIKTRSFVEMKAVLQSNIGLAYFSLYKDVENFKFGDSTNLFMDSAIYSSREKEFLGILAISLGTKALLIQKRERNTSQAEKMLQEAIAIRKNIGQLYFIITDIGKLGEIYYQAHEYEKSVLTCKEALRLADSSGIYSDIIYLYTILAKSLSAAGRYKEYGDVLAVQIRVQDSINKSNAATSLNELTTKYELQKKELLITKQQYLLFNRKILIYIIFILGFVLLTYAIIKFRKFRKQNIAKMEIERRQARETERERITADLHDDIGATLSSMKIYGELADQVWQNKPELSKEMVRKISSSSKDLLDRMSDIVWSLKTADDEKNTIEARLKNYCNELLLPKNILCEFTIDEKLAVSVNNPEVRKNILLIAKEALNNIAKYSGATKAVISFIAPNEKAILTIMDNGKGIDIEKVKFGNGLQNIKKRCEFLGGVFYINTPENGGTCINCDFPIAIISHTG
jgi:signal transduction histidine kinase